MELIFTNDDAGGARGRGPVEQFERVAAWLESRGLRATWFWVPKGAGRPGDQDPDWIPALNAAIERGHDVQLHGLTHATCLEFGVPQEGTWRANPKPKEAFDAEPERWRLEHGVDSLSAKLREARQLYGSAFQDVPLIFRAPCFGMGDTAYQALAANGIRYSSSRGINPHATAYMMLGDPELHHWWPEYPCRPYRVEPGVIEYPCLEDLAPFGVGETDLSEREALFREELSAAMAEAGPDGVLVFGTHYHSMSRNWELTRRLLDRLLDWLRDQGVSACPTFKQYLSA